MKFWQVEPPDYNDDYQSFYVNGELDHPYSIPGVKCGVCNETWAGSRVLDIVCPAPLRNHLNLKSGWPISVEEHRLLQQEIYVQLANQPSFFDPLQPGDMFQPCSLVIPSTPVADFLWAGIGSVLVSERIKKLFEDSTSGGLRFCPVSLRKVGNRKAKWPAPIPSTCEPEDIIWEVPLLSLSSSTPAYFELVILCSSGYAPGFEPSSVCPVCGLKTFDETDGRSIMLESMWTGADIFFLAETNYIVVTDQLKLAIQSLNATNVEFKSFGT